NDKAPNPFKRLDRRVFHDLVLLYLFLYIKQSAAVVCAVCKRVKTSSKPACDAPPGSTTGGRQYESIREVGRAAGSAVACSPAGRRPAGAGIDRGRRQGRLRCRAAGRDRGSLESRPHRK